MGKTRFLREFVGTLLFGVFVSYFLIEDFRFSSRAKRGEAVILGSFGAGRSGLRFARVSHRTDAGTIPAEVQGWFWHPIDGERIPTLYDPADPHSPIRDYFWRRHDRLLLASAFLLVVASGEAVARHTRRRLKSIDRRLVTASQ